mmetsp:Transcript_17458/g.47747  ORF Transcript_17458/g.47747 Transcript_17458/m.47747 type:complete len:222 (-) Transcript_17458:49-714(-)
MTCTALTALKLCGTRPRRSRVRISGLAVRRTSCSKACRMVLSVIWFFASNFRSVPGASMELTSQLSGSRYCSRRISMARCISSWQNSWPPSTLITFWQAACMPSAFPRAIASCSVWRASACSLVCSHWGGSLPHSLQLRTRAAVKSRLADGCSESKGLCKACQTSSAPTRKSKAVLIAMMAVSWFSETSPGKRSSSSNLFTCFATPPERSSARAVLTVMTA